MSTNPADYPPFHEFVATSEATARILSPSTPLSAASSADFFHEEPWLDFNMRQNGHTIDHSRFPRTRKGYDRQPVKPVLDGEPAYEGHPIDHKANDFGHTLASDVGRPLYWNLFSGAFGHTYGHHSTRQMFSEGRQPVNAPLKTRQEALDDSGAEQMHHGRRLIESRPFLTRVPDDSIFVPSPIPTDVPGAGIRRFVATCDEGGSSVFIYFPVNKSIEVRLDVIRQGPVVAWWFNPRDGTAEKIGDFPNTSIRRFTPASPGEAADWILVLDDKSKNYPPQGNSPKWSGF